MGFFTVVLHKICTVLLNTANLQEETEYALFPKLI